jgi:hypothetical protein
MADDSVLDEIQANTKEAGQMLRASLSLLHSQGIIDDADYCELALRLRSSLAMVEAVYIGTVWVARAGARIGVIGGKGKRRNTSTGCLYSYRR